MSFDVFCVGEDVEVMRNCLLGTYSVRDMVGSTQPSTVDSPGVAHTRLGDCPESRRNGLGNVMIRKLEVGRNSPYCQPQIREGEA
jgi:hypothetical protein